jgi:hypothetical protein
MVWTADTDFKNVGLNTVLTIMETPQIDGEPPARLMAGVWLAIIFADNRREPAEIISASETEAVIQLQNGSSWKMTPQTSADVPIGPKTTLAHIKWVVRSKAD